MPRYNLRGWLSPLVHLSTNWISLIGVTVVTSATIFWLFLLPTTIRADIENPYIGILSYMVLPGVFFTGLALIPLGIWLQWRRQQHKGTYPLSFPPLNWQNVEFRRLVVFLGLMTFVNIVIASQFAYGAINYMDSVTFCGQTCHTVMQPEATAHQASPHAKVECVKCHIGPGAGWFVKSKLSGVGQVFAVAFNSYPRPIPTPVHNLRPARETCETCHWPQKYGADRIRIFPKFAEDEANTQTKTVLLMKIGGGNHGIGIHGTHLGPGVRIRYAHSDEGRQKIPWVDYEINGKQTVYAEKGVNGPGNMPVREMDCMDCHNRPSHTYEMPERALDSALFNGSVSPTLPFAKKKALEILKASYPSREVAATQIPQTFENYYKQSQPAVYAQHEAEVKSSAQGVLAIWNRNIFPAMNVTWGKYPNNVGHTDFPGCFRCHDDNHVASGGAKITQDCNACHNLLAMEEPAPKILTDLGIGPNQTTTPK